MKYMKRFKSQEEDWQEVSYEEALRTILGTYRDCLDVRSMMSIANFIPCVYSEIRVYDDNGKTAKEGEMCLIPDEILYLGFLDSVAIV